MLRITPEHGTFRVARQVTFDARRRSPRTAGGLGCSATISGLGGVFIAGSDIDQPSCWAEKPRSGSGEGLVPFLSLQSIAITQSRIMAKDDTRLPLLERQQQDLYREAVRRSGRPWKAIAGKAIKRPKTFKNDSSSSSAPFMPTSAGWTSTHSPLTKAQASPGVQRAGMPSQSTNLGSIFTIWGSGRQNAPRPADQLAAKLSEALEGAFLIEPGQPGISRYVGGQDGGKLERSPVAGFSPLAIRLSDVPTAAPGVAFRAEHWTGSTSCLQENDNLVLDLADPAGPTKRADRPHATAQRDLAGHRNVAARRNAGHHRRSRSPWRPPQTDSPWGLPPPARARGCRGDRTGVARCRNRPRASARRTPPPRSTPSSPRASCR